MSALLQEHFSLLDSDRENDRIGPRIPLTTLEPWHNDTELWGDPYVRREDGEIHVWAVLFWHTADSADPPLDKPCFRLPRTMWPRKRAHGIETDWRNGYRLRLEPDGYVYCEAI